jgi:hypothetical protein
MPGAAFKLMGSEFEAWSVAILLGRILYGVRKATSPGLFDTFAR